MNELPTMYGSNLSAQSYAAANNLSGLQALNFQNAISDWSDNSTVARDIRKWLPQPSATRLARFDEEEEMAETEQNIALRVVQVFVSDPDKKLKPEDRLLFKGDILATDATDEELFYELDIKSLLKAQNEKRVKVRDKAVKDKEVFLEPIRIRDLAMTVVTYASFPERESIE